MVNYISIMSISLNDTYPPYQIFMQFNLKEHFNFINSYIINYINLLLFYVSMFGNFLNFQSNSLKCYLLEKYLFIQIIHFEGVRISLYDLLILSHQIKAYNVLITFPSYHLLDNNNV